MKIAVVVSTLVLLVALPAISPAVLGSPEKQQEPAERVQPPESRLYKSVEQQDPAKSRLYKSVEQQDPAERVQTPRSRLYKSVEQQDPAERLQTPRSRLYKSVEQLDPAERVQTPRSRLYKSVEQQDPAERVQTPRSRLYKSVEQPRYSKDPTSRSSEELPRINQDPESNEPEVRGVNWVELSKAEYPFLVRINNYHQSVEKVWSYEPCGGSLVTPKLVLTAAHCYDGQKKRYGTPNAVLVRVYVNDYDVNAVEPDQDMDIPTSVTIHEGYEKIQGKEVNKNDIALILLSKAEGEASHAVCLGSHSIGAVDVTITGWGTTSSGGSMAMKTRRSSHEKSMTNADCRATGYADWQITSDMICATGVTGDGKVEDACQGDSGGPMILKNKNSNGRFVQVGVVSWGAGCADKNYPGVYARVSEFVEYVKSQASSLDAGSICVS